MKNEEAASVVHCEQGSDEWISLRKTKITATDAPIIMGASPWKTKWQLYHEKLSNDKPSPPNARMQRGIDLEPIARQLFALQTGIFTYPKVMVKGWAMASLDGIDSDHTVIVEIKCPGKKDHDIAVSGKVPDHYYPQLQHQLYVTNLPMAYYFSFDGQDGVYVEVPRNQEYIHKMVQEEMKFYECLVHKIEPDSSEIHYVNRDDDEWEAIACHWKSVTSSIKELQLQEIELRNRLLELSGKSNSKGAGIYLSLVRRKGSIDHSKIPELKNVDLEPYRNPETSCWRITLSE